MKTIGIVVNPGGDFERDFVKGAEVYQGNISYLVMQAISKAGYDIKNAQSAEEYTFTSIIYFGQHDYNLLYKHKYATHIYLALEPEVVDYQNKKGNLEKLLKYYDYIMTWNNDIVDNERIFHIQYAQNLFEFDNKVSFEDKNLICCISGNKTSKVARELYSERVKVIEFFENNSQDIRDKFGLYGFGWDTANYSVYKGCVESKALTYQNYKFALCLENAEGLNGYITEKIFDCFVAGIVPIYTGASNINDFISQGCYIRYDDFDNVASLTSYLKSMEEDDWKRYINNAKEFLESEAISPFKPESVAKSMVAVLTKPKKQRVTFFALVLDRKLRKSSEAYKKFRDIRKRLKNRIINVFK